MQGPDYEILRGDMREILSELPEACIDAVVTDPPYGLEFMSKGWDRSVPGPDYWREVFRVLKPGGHLIAFGGTRTAHRLACAIEDSGFEIRDCLMWLYGSGFPKSHNLAVAIDKAAGHPNRGRAIPTASSYQAHDKDQSEKLTSNPVGEYAPRTPEAEQWAGWGTALKPAWEPIYLARKPFKGATFRNVLEHGTGALHIDACRIGRVEGDRTEYGHHGGYADSRAVFGQQPERGAYVPADAGRWPANLILDEAAGEMLDGQTGTLKSGALRSDQYKDPSGKNGSMFAGAGAYEHKGYAPDSGGASRFFYCAKASRAEREAGLEDFAPATVSDGRAKAADNAYQRGKTERKNKHPTVKPISLMRYLVRLITPPGGVVLDPFCGSGSTGCAAMLEGFEFVGIDLDSDNVFCDIATARIEHWRAK